ncbi:hypothetical protein ACOSQ2_012077 [Xanthoceras sorbifolium]
MGIPLHQDRVGLVIQGLGSFMLEDCHNHFIFTRFAYVILAVVLHQLEGNGCQLTWELKFLKTLIKLLKSGSFSNRTFVVIKFLWSKTLQALLFLSHKA